MLKKICIVAAFSLCLLATPASAAVSQVVQGGTGSSTLSGLLKGNGTNPVRTAVPGTDYTLITAKTCNSGDFVSAVTTPGVFTCTTPGSTNFSTTSADYYLSTKSTTNLAEGTNLYFTNARAVTALTGQNVSIFTNDAGYLTPTTFNTDFDVRLTATTSLPKITTLAALSLPYTQVTGTPDLTQYFKLTDWYATTSAPQLNAGSATKLQNARTINGVSFDGTANITIAAANAVSTSTGETAGQLAVWTSTIGSPALLGKVATSTLTASSPLTGSFTQIGTGGSIGCQTASGSQAGCLSSTDWTTFNNKGSGTVTSVASTWPITGGTFTTSGTLAWGGIATSTNIASSQVLYATGPNTFAGIATSSETCSAPLVCASHGVLVGGGAITWSGLATTSQPASSNILVSNGSSGVYGVATSSETCSAPLSCAAHGVLIGGGAIAWTGLATTSQPSTSNLLYSTGGAGVAGVATTSATCGTGVSCTAFPVIGGLNPSFALSVPVSIANGGTNQTSFGTSNGIAAFDGTRLTNFAGYTLTSSLLSATNATTTAFSNSSNATFTGTINSSAEQDATSTAITLNWASTKPQVEYQIGTSATTITPINATTSQQYGSRKIVWVCNPPSASAGALTWVGVQWIGSTPTQTTTAGQCDVYSFDITEASSTSAWKIAGTAGTGFQ